MPRRSQRAAREAPDERPLRGLGVRRPRPGAPRLRPAGGQGRGPVALAELPPRRHHPGWRGAGAQAGLRAEAAERAEAREGEEGAEEDEDELEEDERADDDCDGDDPDDPPEVDLEAALAEDEASAPLLTPAPQESRAKRAPEASQPSTPEASPTLSPKALAKLRAFDAAPPASPRADLDVSPGAREDGSAGTPSPEYSTDASPGPRGDASPTATVPRRLRQVLVQPTTTCPVCGEPSHRYRPELPELLRDLCRRDRTRARAWMFDGKERTPEQARARLIAVAAGELTSHQLTTPAGLVSARAEQAPEDVVATLREAAPAPTPKRPPPRRSGSPRSRRHG